MSGFREFITRGNVVDLAVAVIIGVAFTAIIASLTDDIIMPVVGYLFGGLDFSSYFVLLGEVPDGIDPYNYEALKEAGVPMVGYGQFITAAVNFLIIAFIIYMIVKMLKKAAERSAGAAAAAADPAEVLLLREIRDELRARSLGGGGHAIDNG